MTNELATSTIDYETPRRLNRQYLLALREAAIADPRQATAIYGVSRQEAEHMAQLPLHLVEQLANDAVVRFRSRANLLTESLSIRWDILGNETQAYEKECPPPPGAL